MESNYELDILIAGLIKISKYIRNLKFDDIKKLYIMETDITSINIYYNNVIQNDYKHTLPQFIIIILRNLIKTPDIKKWESNFICVDDFNVAVNNAFARYQYK